MMDVVIGFVVFTAAVITLIMYGVIVGSRREEALGMTQIKRWRKDWAPLTLVIDDKFADDEFKRIEDSVKSAARFWNQQTGLKLFAAPGTVARGGNVVPVMDEPITETGHETAVAFASLRFTLTGAIGSASVTMSDWRPLSQELLARSMKHELGHCLGLAHDENEYSVMYGKVSKRVYCVSELDKAFLQEVYG